MVPAAAGKFKAYNQWTGIKLTWSKVPGAKGYNIYRGSTLTNSASGQMKVTWGKNANASGYQIQYGPDNKWTNATIIKVPKASSVSKVISGLKKNNIYYVRVRSYKGANSSSWSVTKRIKINK